MEGIESFNQDRNMARVKAGLKGGSWYANPVKVPARRIVDGWPPETKAKMQSAPITQMKISDPWVNRR